MPISNGRRGHYGLLALPGRRILRGKPFRSVSFSRRNPLITGTTRDSSGAPLGNCTVQLFRTSNDEFIVETISDGAGSYSVQATGSGPFYLVAYLAGAPDLAGTTVNALIGA